MQSPICGRACVGVLLSGRVHVGVGVMIHMYGFSWVLTTSSVTMNQGLHQKIQCICIRIMTSIIAGMELISTGYKDDFPLHWGRGRVGYWPSQ